MVIQFRERTIQVEEKNKNILSRIMKKLANKRKTEIKETTNRSKVKKESKEDRIPDPKARKFSDIRSFMKVENMKAASHEGVISNDKPSNGETKTTRKPCTRLNPNQDKETNPPRSNRQGETPAYKPQNSRKRQSKLTPDFGGIIINFGGLLEQGKLEGTTKADQLQIWSSSNREQISNSLTTQPTSPEEEGNLTSQEPIEELGPGQKLNL